MTKIPKIVIWIAGWLSFTLLCGYIGTWWPVRNVPRDEIWAGDGIAMMFYGVIGLYCGGMLGAIALIIFWWAKLRTETNKAPDKMGS